MNFNNYAVDEIKSRLNMQSVIGCYFPSLKPRGNRIPCPIHNGKDYNFSFNDAVYHCFVCGAKGDVISFVQEVFSLSFPDALERLNDDFRLGLVFGRRMTLRERREADDRYKELLAERERQPLTRREILSEWQRLKRWAVECDKVPRRNISDADAQAYAQTVSHLNYLEYVLDNQHEEELDGDFNTSMKKYISEISLFGEVPLG